MTESVKNRIKTKNLEKRRRVLCVDDDEINLMVMHHLLNPLLFEIDSAQDGSSALALFKKYRYDLILLDIFMPQMNGLETAAAMRAVNSNYPPIILISAGKIDSLEEQMRLNNIQHFLPKPIDNMALQNIIYQCL